MDIDLWDTEPLAAFLKCNAQAMLQYHAPLPDFPKAIRPPSTSGKGQGYPHWKAEEMIVQAEKYKEGAKGKTEKTPYNPAILPIASK